MIAFFAKHPTAANLLMLIMLVIGLLSIGRLQRESLPDAKPEKLQVTVVYSGATTAEVEEAILERLEDALEGTRYVKEIISFCRPSFASVTLEMTERGDYTAFRNEIENAVNSIDDFPDDAEPALLTRLNTMEPVFDILITGKLTPTDLKAYCEKLRDRLVAKRGVSEIEVDGFSDHLLRVELSREALIRYGLSAVDVSNAISRQSVDMPAGKIEGDENLTVRVRESRKTGRELESLIVAARPGGAEIRLSEIATIVDEFDLDEERVEVDGVRSAILKVKKSKAEDVLTVADLVQEELAKERIRNPAVSLEVINNQAFLVRDRISLLLRNGWQGCLLVFVTMWLFFNARLSFWVVASLPVSFLAAFAFVPGFGLTINMLTMVGLLMALGLLMDDGIVIAENIARRRESGESAMESAINGVTEVANGVFSSFLTTCCVLGPLIFVGGTIGRMLRVLPMMLLLVLATSLVEAFLILPAHLGHSLAHKKPEKPWFRQKVESVIESIRGGVGSLVDWTVEWRYLTMGLTIMVFLFALCLPIGGLVRFQVFPSLEGDTIVARVLLPPGTPLARTEAVVAQLESAMRQTNEHFRPRQPDQSDLFLRSHVRYSQNTDAMESGPHVATIAAELLPTQIRDARISEIVNVWKDEVGIVPDVLSITFDEPALGPTGRAIEVELSGLSLDQMDLVSEQIQAYFRSYEGTYNISDDLRKGESELVVSLRPGAVGLGVTSLDLARQLRGSFQGLLSDQIQVGKEAYEVEVRFADRDRNSTADLQNYLVALPNGQRVPLEEVAQIKPTRGWSRISRTDGRRVVTVMGSVDSTRTNTAAMLRAFQAEKGPQLIQENPGLGIRIKGESEKGAETGQSMAFAAVIGCIGVFVILSFQFRSYIEPAIVMVAIPFSLVGVIFGHYLFGLPLSLPGMMGFASLAGVVVNDSILLVLFLKQKRSEGADPIQAAGQASRVRFRAVMITSLTTIAGLMPLLMERSLQAQVLIPIAVSICFGLLASTILVLLVIPPMYVLLDDFGLTASIESEEDEGH